MKVGYNIIDKVTDQIFDLDKIKPAALIDIIRKAMVNYFGET